MTDDVTFYDDIEGYCGALSYGHGDVAHVHVSTQRDRFDIAVHRWGATRELVFSAADLPGRFTTAPDDADSAGCRWPSSVEIPIGDDWRSGFYLVTMTAHGAAADRGEAHACFVVRADEADRSAALLVLSTNTWNAYNTWGGASLYTGGHTVSFERPMARGMLCHPEVDRDDRKSRPTRWGEQPDVNGDLFQEYRFAHGYPAAIGSAGWFAHERRFVEWAEARGHRVDYCISSDLDDDTDIASGYDLVIDVGHDEYWSAGQRDTIEQHVRNGGNFASFSGNTMFWQVRLEGGAMVCHKYTAITDDPVVADDRPEQMSGMWCDPIVGRPEWELLGAGSAWGLYSRFGQATPRGSGGYTVYRADHWLLADTGLRYGDVLGAKHGVVGYETVGRHLDFDEFQLPVARPLDGAPDSASSEVVAFTPSSNVGVGEYPASISALSDQGDLEFIASRLFGRVDDDSLARCRHGNTVMMVTRPFATLDTHADTNQGEPSTGAPAGEVVVIGTTDWVYGLADDDAVAQVTANVLDRYLR